MDTPAAALLTFFQSTTRSIRASVVNAILAACSTSEVAGIYKATHRILKSNSTTFSALADELLLDIFTRVDTKTLCALSCVNKRLYILLQYDNSFWLRLCRKRAFAPIKKQVQKTLDWAPWKSVYKENIITDRNWAKGRYSLSRISRHSGSICLSFNEEKVVSVGRLNGILWDLNSGDTLLSLQGHHQGFITTAKFDDKWIISGSIDSTVRVFDLKDGRCVSTLDGHTGEIVAVANDKNGNIISGSEDCTIRYWKLNPGPAWECSAIFRGHTGAVTCLQFQENTLVSGSSDSSIIIWDIREMEKVVMLTHHTGPVFCVGFDENYLVSGGQDCAIRIFDIRKFKVTRRISCIKTLEGHAESIVCLQFDKVKIVSGSADRSIKVWDISTGRCLYTLRHHVGPVWNLAFSKSKLMSSSFDDETKLLVWDFSQEDQEKEY